jgi:hypothetical protein
VSLLARCAIQDLLDPAHATGECTHGIAQSLKLASSVIACVILITVAIPLSLTSVDARVLDDAFRAKLADFEVLSPEDIAASSRMTGPLIAEASNSTRIDKSELSFPEPRRLRDRHHVKYVICGRQPSDPHRLRFAQPRALGRKVSDEFTVPLCRSHHREVHRSSDEIGLVDTSRY